MTIYVLTPETSVVVWDDIVTLIAPAMVHHPFMTVDDVLTMVRAGHATTMVAIGDNKLICCVVLTIDQYPGRRVANILALGAIHGRFAEVRDEMWAAAIAWSKYQNCDTISGTGRRGWLRSEFGNVWQERIETTTCWLRIEEAPEHVKIVSIAQPGEVPAHTTH